MNPMYGGNSLSDSTLYYPWPRNESVVGILAILSFGAIKAKVAEHLKTAVDADEFDIKSAKLEELQGFWKIDVEFKKPKAEFSETALLIIDSTTGEVKEFRRGY